jgi:thiosulfate/3-mercaptopyruvate sulfurtransferase
MSKWLKMLVIAASLSFTSSYAAAEFEKNDVLISAEEAIKLIGKPGVVFASGDSHDVFKLGHIKGSVEMYAHHLHHSDIMGNMHCEPLFNCIHEMEEYIGSKGIDNNTLVIAYDDYKGPNATGVYAYFKSIGHKKVKILDGGRHQIMQHDPNQAKFNDVKKQYKKEKKVAKKAQKALKADKKEKKLSKEQIAALKATISESKKKQKAFKKKMKKIEKTLLVVKGDEKIKPKKYKINKKKLDFTRIAGKNEVRHAMEDILKNGKNSEYVIIDTRGMTEIIGERKMDNVARGGHVPGATFIEWKKISDGDRKLSFREPADIQAVFDSYGVSKDKKIYAYCHVGTGRSSEIITALEMLGYPNAKIYTGSWNQWGNDMNLPVER